MHKFLLSVVIPSYNEMGNLRKGILDKVEHYLTKQQYDYEVIIVDDGSDDGSLEFVREFVADNKKFKLIENSHMGKAGAVTTGVLAAHGPYILFTDMDQATPIGEVEKLLPFIDPPAGGGYDVVIGSRSSRPGAPLSRRFMSRSSVFLRKLIVGIPTISDTQCGFKLFKKDAAHAIFEKVKKIHRGFRQIHGSSVTSGFDIELLYIAQKMGYRIKEVPVDWLYVETRRVSPIKDSVEGFSDLLTIRKNITKGIYD